MVLLNAMASHTAAASSPHWIIQRALKTPTHLAPTIWARLSVIFNGGSCSGDLSFLYDSGIFTSLIYPGAGLTFANGINDAGQITGYADLSSSVPEPSTWGMMILGF